MHKFGKGFATGVATMIGVTAGVLFSFKKAVVEPIESKEKKAEDNRKRSLRKSGSSHLG